MRSLPPAGPPRSIVRSPDCMSNLQPYADVSAKRHRALHPLYSVVMTGGPTSLFLVAHPPPDAHSHSELRIHCIAMAQLGRHRVAQEWDLRHALASRCELIDRSVGSALGSTRYAPRSNDLGLPRGGKTRPPDPFRSAGVRSQI